MLHTYAMHVISLAGVQMYRISPVHSTLMQETPYQPTLPHLHSCATRTSGLQARMCCVWSELGNKGTHNIPGITWITSSVYTITLYLWPDKCMMCVCVCVCVPMCICVWVFGRAHRKPIPLVITDTNFSNMTTDRLNFCHCVNKPMYHLKVLVAWGTHIVTSRQFDANTVWRSNMQQTKQHMLCSIHPSSDVQHTTTQIGLLRMYCI